MNFQDLYNRVYDQYQGQQQNPYNNQLHNLLNQQQSSYKQSANALQGLLNGLGNPRPILVKKRTIEDVDKELDILRGRVPTPKGYKVDPSRVKELMAERRALLHS